MPNTPKQVTTWTEEERMRIVGAFDLLLKMDKKQNPHLYEIKKETSNRRNKKDTKHK